MKCNDNIILLYWSGDLSQEESASVEQHLQGCPACASYFAELCCLDNTVEEIQPEKDLVSIALQKSQKKTPILQFILKAAAVVTLVVWQWHTKNGAMQHQQ